MNKKHFFVGDGVPDEPKPPIVTGDGTAYTPGVDVVGSAAKTDPNWDMDKKKWMVLPGIFMEPQEDRVLILPDPAMEKSAGGIIVAEAYQDRHVPSRGTVVAVGPGKDLGGSGILQKIYKLLCKVFKQEYDLHGSMPFKVGDRVMYGHYAGVPVNNAHDDSDRKTYLIMRLNDVFIKL